MTDKNWVVFIHGCKKDFEIVVGVTNLDPLSWCKKNIDGKFDGKLIENDENFELYLPNNYITYEISGDKYAKKFGMLHNSCGLYITFIDKQENTVHQIMDAIFIK